MPYIKEKLRKEMLNRSPENPGELNYAITIVIKSYLNKNGLNYNTINDIIGVLECSKQEFYRRVAIDYENKKIKENGDVY